ncbi:MAG: hemolysin family protein [Candidatus Omnitrophica bacterium]|nr:hemolysin family protein [Candidatus Omnitrophota bacterium]
MDILFIIFFIFFLGIFSFFFSAWETAILSLNKLRIRSYVNQGKRRAEIVYNILTHLDRFIVTILVSNNFVNIALSALGAALFIYLFGQKFGILISTIAISFFILIFCEITPKIIATKYPEAIALKFAYFIKFLIKLVQPLAHFFTYLSNGIIKLLGVETKKRSPLVTEEEIRLMIELGREEGILLEEERKLIHHIFEFGDTLVKDVMIPREKMVCVELNASEETLLDLLIEKGHTRIPVYKETLDNIVGIIYAKDLPFMWKNGSLIIIADIMHPAYFVSLNKKVSELLQDFQKMKIQIAIVRNDVNKVMGLVTLEDILEEIVGEIEESPR